MTHPTVLIRHCDAYDAGRLAHILGEGMDALGARPHGRTMIKPNVVVAVRGRYELAHTRAEFIEGLLAAVRARDGDVTELAVGERSALTVPTRFGFHHAGYGPAIKRHRAKAYYFEEYPNVEVPLRHPDALRPYVYVPTPVAACDFLINAPKLKAHAWCKMTCALKNYIGLQDSGHRIIDHDFHLHQKIVDLQEILTPGFIAVDAITAGELTMMSPTPRRLGLIVMGTNQVAVDVVCAHILGLDPHAVDHIRIAGARGLGPLDVADIALGGDVPFEEARARGAGFQLSVEKVDAALRRKTDRITVHLGLPPDAHGGDYCWGGCPGALWETVESLQRAWQPDVYERLRPMTYVFGDYRGAINPKPGEPVIFFGDCACWRGRLNGRVVEVESTYTPHSRIDPRRHRASVDVVRILLRFLWDRVRHWRRPYHRVYGCPASMHEHHVRLAFLGGAKNPYFDARLFLSFTSRYVWSNLVRRWRITAHSHLRRPAPGPQRAARAPLDTRHDLTGQP
ncbi:MAG: DUF362 domain-containing protein [Anaerolineae bacterium]|nr:DUF362 domain-containing protein [Anaerolineae bacterium]